MPSPSPSRGKLAALWAALLVAVALPLGLAATSPLLAWRDPVYIAAGFAGVIGLALMLFQPLLAIGALPGLALPRARRVHQTLGTLLALAVLVHVLGLWITSPPDVIDVLLFRSPTPFSVWGVLAMWAVFATGVLAAYRRKLRIPPRRWRRIHKTLAGVIVVGTVVHALLIEGTMEVLSKSLLCALVLGATGYAVLGVRRVANRRP